MAASRRVGSGRRQEILRYLREHGSATVAALCAVTAASPATVHRDLEQLAAQGLLERVHGGALSLESDDPPVGLARVSHVAEKHAIAEYAAKLIDDDVASIFLEASTTIAAMVPWLRSLEDKVFVTNSPEMGLELVTGPSDVILIGGDLRARTLSSVGPLAIQALEGVSIDLAFIGVSAIDADGLSSMNLIEAETKSAILAGAARSIALGDSGKLGKRALAPVGPLSHLESLVTDSNAPEEEVRKLRKAGLTVSLAGANASS